MPGEVASDAQLSLGQEIDRVMKSIAIDRLVLEIRTRSKRLHSLNCNFGFLLDVKTLLSGEIDLDSLKAQCSDLPSIMKVMS